MMMMMMMMMMVPVSDWVAGTVMSLTLVVLDNCFYHLSPITELDFSLSVTYLFKFQSFLFQKIFVIDMYRAHFLHFHCLWVVNQKVVF